MVYCLAADVLLILETDVSDTDLTALIVEADKEIDARGLGSRSTVKQISMLLTASLAAMRRPFPDQNVGDARARGPLEYRQMAEDLIARGDIAFQSYTEPIE